MNRNTLLAFLLIIVSFLFFQSDFYHKTILRKETNPFKQRQVTEKQVPDTTKAKEEKEKKDTLVVKDTVVKQDELLAAAPDSAQQDTVPPVTIDTIWVETDKLICGITERGGKIISIKTKDFTYSNGKEGEDKDFIELVPGDSEGGAGLRINEKSFNAEVFKYNGDKKKLSLNDKEKLTLQFVCTLQDNQNLIKQFTFHKDNYKIGYSIISDVIDGKHVEIGWGCGINESEKSVGRMAQLDLKRVHLYDGKHVEHIIMKKRGGEERTGYYNWMGVTSKYFLLAVVPEKIKDTEIRIKAFEVKTKEGEEDKKKHKTLNFNLLYKVFASGKKESFWLYAGPSQLTELKSYEIGLQKVLFRGYGWFFRADLWFPAVCEFVLWLLIQLQKGVKDYGVVIIILTIILRIVTYPLTQSSMKSMNKMKEVQPRLNKIREKYKGNPKLMNQKMMDFYRNEGINPLGGMGGCLPMILQMPIMISLFIVLRKAIELRGQGTVLIPWIKDLSKAEVFIPLPEGFNIPFYGSNIALLPIIMAVLMYFQNKATIKDPNQKMMIYFMPIMMLVLFNNFPSGLVLYFTFSTALQVLQQFIMDKKKKATS